MKLKFLGTGAAVFSPDSMYRYSLTRDWKDSMPLLSSSTRTIDDDHGKLTFIMLNPSVADAEFNDPTIHRCQRRALALSYSSMEIVNIFAYRSTDPNGLRLATDPIGPANDAAIISAAEGANMIICAWGSKRFPLVYARQLSVLTILKDLPLHVLRLNSDGTPGHPLYLPYKTKPYSWHPHWRHV
jgi:hypothetical protein